MTRIWSRNPCLLRLVVLSWLASVANAINGDANFGYESTTDVAKWLKLASDVKEMRLADSMEDRERIYREGNHSSITLASLSLTSYDTFQTVPIYNLYIAAFRVLGVTLEDESLGSFDGAPVEQYADTLVGDLFDLGIERIEGTGAVVYNVLMAYWGYLGLMLQACQENNSDGAIEALDTAVALWIGEGQLRSDKQSGYFMYSISQFAGVQFDQDRSESVQNTQVMELFTVLQSSIQAGSCADPAYYHLEMRWQVQLLVQYANTVLVQMLLHHIQDSVDNGTPSDFVELYSLALGPQIEACDTELYQSIEHLTVTSDISADTRADAIASFQQSYSCLGITCEDVGGYLNGLIPKCTDRDNDITAPLPMLTSYQPSTDVRDISYIDRDIRQIRMFMEVGSWTAAAEYYQYGWNSEFTLQEMATSALDSFESTDSTLFDEYYSNGNTVDSLVLGALQASEPFATAADPVRIGIVNGVLQTIVMYLGVKGQLSASLSSCDDNQVDQAEIHWDAAAALFVGSTEGQSSSGQPGGESLFAVSKFLCAAFDKCEPDSSVDDIIVLASLQSGANVLKQGECETARQIYTEKLQPGLLIPFVQGFLYYSVETSKSPNTDAQGYLLAFTKALLPFMNTGSSDSEAPIDYAFYVGTSPEIDLASTFEVVRLSLPGMGIDCLDVGRIEVNGVATGVCSDDQPPPAPSAPSSPSAPTSPTASPALPPVFVPEPHAEGLAWGRYTFVDKDLAEQDSMFTLDVRDMWFSVSPEAAETIYSNPSTHAVNGLSGRPEVQSLKHFSTEAHSFMSEDPMYNFFRVALFEDEAFEDVSGQTWPYADAVEQLAIGPQNGNSAQLGSETVVVMEIWMMIANRLYDAVRNCGASLDAPELIDSAVGLWIGQEQGSGKYNSGWSIYAVAQEARRLYGMPEGEAKVNEDLMVQFGEAQTIAKTCSTEPSSFLGLRGLVDDIIRNLSIPLLQHLLFHMSDNTFEYVELYALSFAPQAVSVDMGAFEFLRDRLFEGFDWQSSIDLDMFSVMGKTLYAMRMSCEDLGDVSSSDSTNLIGLVEALCNEMTTTYDSNKLAAYETSVDVRELARIDLDVLQIGLFMRARAYEAALDVYEHGRNALSSPSSGNDYAIFFSLKELSTSGENSTDELAVFYRDFFESGTYPDSIINDALTGPETGRFTDFSRLQLSEAVRRTLQTMVMYIPIHSRLEEAIQECNDHSQDLGSASLWEFGQGKVDEAVALYIGSIEGPFSGGNPAAGGQLMYELAKEMCSFFNRCDSHGDADVNIDLLFAFAGMKENLDSKNCVAAEEILQDTILPSLPIPMIQGILHFADRNEGLQAEAGNTTFVAGDFLTETLLPQIVRVNETSAVTILENMDFIPGQTSVPEGKEAVFDAFAPVVRDLGIDCSSVGLLESAGLSICIDSTLLAPPPDTPVTLGDNIYEATTFVENLANIAKDVVEMEEEISLGRMTQAELVYKEGRFSFVYDDDGNRLDNPRAFAKFSTNAASTMGENPLYQMTVFALRDENGLYLGKNASQYADTIVDQMFAAGHESRDPLAPEAAVALNLWMELANELFETVANCKNQVLTDVDGIHSIDEAAAYWIGDGQITGSSENGHLLYALAEKMADHFSISTSPHSRTNDNILRLFHQAKLEMSLTNACTENEKSPARVRRIVDKIVSQMVIVNIQALIHYLRQNSERDRVRIYAHAVVPLIAGCSPKTFEYLKAKLLDASYLAVDVEQIIADIRSTLPCFNLKCEDIGVHSTEPPSACSDPSTTSALAGYTPAHDVREFAQMDLDILELDILMQMEAFEAAADLYSFGKHVSLGSNGDGTALSLEHLATDSERTSAPQFEAYLSYFDNNDKYADTIVRGALSRSSGMSSIQRRAVVVGASRYLIMYMASLQAMYDAIGSCSSTDATRQSTTGTSWDMAAAMVIGSLEGTGMGGSEEGLLLWGLSKQFCDEFRTCSEETDGSSETNDKVATLFYSGRGAILSGSCDDLEEAANELAPLLQVPLLQASFSAVITLTEHNPGKNKEEVQAEAYVYSQALLPLIDVARPQSARIIAENLPLQGSPLIDGVRAVVEAFADSLSSLGVDCEDVGASEYVDACSGSTSSNKAKKLGWSLGIILPTIAVVGIFLLLRSRRKNLPENKPVFITPKDGELNHTSDVLISRTAGSSPGSSDAEDEHQDLNDADDPMEESENSTDPAYVKSVEEELTKKLHSVV